MEYGFDWAQSDMRKGSRQSRRPALQSCGLIPPNSSEPVTKDRNVITKIYDHKTYTPERWGSLTCKTNVCGHCVYRTDSITFRKAVNFTNHVDRIARYICKFMGHTYQMKFPELRKLMPEPRLGNKRNAHTCWCRLATVSISPHL
jgi:hypothetical protein